MAAKKRTKKKAVERWSETRFHLRLEQRYTAPAWAYLRHVNEATGAISGRVLDAIAMSLWPSRGLDLIGLEIKCSRADLRREIANPNKAESVAKYCDYFYIVAPKKVVTGIEHEIPPAWGIITEHGKGLRQHREAQRTEAVEITRKFLAAVLRRADEQTGMGTLIKKERDAAWQKGREWQQRHERSTAERIQKDLDQLRECVRAYEKASGLSISRGYDSPHEVGETVRMLRRGSLDNLLTKLKHFHRDVARLGRNHEWFVDQIAKAIENIEAHQNSSDAPTPEANP